MSTNNSFAEEKTGFAYLERSKKKNQKDLPKTKLEASAKSRTPKPTQVSPKGVGYNTSPASLSDV